MEPLKISDVVTLVSGGPMMTVVDFDKQEQGMVACAWITREGEPRRESYPERALEKIPRDNEHVPEPDYDD
jgi:uncharacterized protein YodC (DUF2158 family)